MLIIPYIILFRISYNFSALFDAPNSMYYSQNYSQDNCQHNPLALKSCFIAMHDRAVARSSQLVRPGLTLSTM